MSLWESVTLALSSLRTNRMRSMLTLLGVIIGIASVIAILTLGKSLQTQTMKSLEQFGVTNLTLQVQARSQQKEAEADPYYGGPVDPSARITPDMVDDLRDRFQGRISGVSIGDTSSYRATATRSLQTSAVSLKPVNADHLSMQQITLTAGRLLAPEDTDADRPVTVIPSELVTAFFQGDPQRALGQEIDMEVDGHYVSFMVVGTYEKPRSTGALAMGPEEVEAFVPYTAAMRCDARATESVEQVSIRAAAGVEPDSLKQDVQTWADRHYADNPDFQAKVLDMKKELEQLNQTMATMSIAISAIGGISLLVGGIGVMNIMLITVTERTREIGVRKALGATRRAIRTQFVVEAMIVCLIGGAFGVLLGGGLGMLGAKLLGTFVLPPPLAIMVSLGFALAIGLFFGWYPANKAAKLDPIEALRYE